MQKKHSILIRGHSTSFSLEDDFWFQIQSIAKQNKQSIASLVTKIDEERPRDTNLSSALRLFVLKDCLSKID